MLPIHYAKNQEKGFKKWYNKPVAKDYDITSLKHL